MALEIPKSMVKGKGEKHQLFSQLSHPELNAKQYSCTQECKGERVENKDEIEATLNHHFS